MPTTLAGLDDGELADALLLHHAHRFLTVSPEAAV
jgi:hypothetical protein